MATPLKELYTPQFLAGFTTYLKQVLPDFPDRIFTDRVFSADWLQLELKGRIRRISTLLEKLLPGTYERQLHAIVTTVRLMLARPPGKHSIEYLFLPDFVEQFGTSHPELSLDAMEEITQFITCEFAIRPFLLKDQGAVLRRMMRWTKHAHPAVRRLASEGCRPRLPWGTGVPALKKDPSPILPILEALKEDSSDSVRRSVANNLNDIAKDHPLLVVGIARQWKGQSEHTDWILRHGCRTLLRLADPDIFALFGLQQDVCCSVTELHLHSKTVRIGEILEFSFMLIPGAPFPVRLRIDYIIYYRKSGGRHGIKIFRIGERQFEPGRSRSFKRKQSFADMTTRRHYPGTHRLAISVNGKEMSSIEFEVTNQ